MLVIASASVVFKTHDAFFHYLYSFLCIFLSGVFLNSHAVASDPSMVNFTILLATASVESSSTRPYGSLPFHGSLLLNDPACQHAMK